MAIREFHEQHLKALEELAKGENKSKVAELTGVNRKTIDRWLEDDYFKAELDRQVAELKNRVNERLLMNVEPLMDKLISIALKSKSEKTSLDATIYALNRLCGTPSSKIEQTITGDKDSNNANDIDDIQAMINKYKGNSDDSDNVIDMEDIKNAK